MRVLPNDADGVINARLKPWHETVIASEPFVNVTAEPYGAVGDGVVDDTTAIQAAIDATLSIDGGFLYFPDGQYLISASLEIPLYTGWRIQGESRGGTVIVQDTDDTPCITFTKENCHSFCISDISFSWTNVQASTDTDSVALLVDTDTQTGAGVYNGVIDRVSWNKGFRGFDARYSAWGMTIDHIVHGGDMTGACIKFDPSPTIGQPNNRLGTVYVSASSATETLVTMVACGQFTIGNYEVNNNPNGVQILNLSGASNGTIEAIRIETGTYDTHADCIIGMSDSYVEIGTMQTDVTIGATGTHYFAKWEAGTTGSIHIDTLDLYATVSADNFFAFGGGAKFSVGRVKQLTGAYLTDVDNNAAATTTTVADWLTPHLSDDNGDASITLDMGDETVQMFQTELTQNRTVSLPVHAFAATNVFNGAWFRIVRNANTPGNFTLTVQTAGAATIKEIPSATNAIVEVMYRRSEWVVTNYVELP